MARIKKLALAALVAFALAGGAAAYIPSQQLAGGKDPEFPSTPGLASTGDSSQWGVYKKGSFDRSEAEQIAGGKDPEYPTTPGLA